MTERVGAFKVFILVVSRQNDPEEIARMLGMGSDESRGIGGRKYPWSPPAEFNLWKKAIKAPPGLLLFEDAEKVVLGLGLDFARLLGQLSACGDEVELSIVQEVTDPDDSTQKGIHFGADLIQWLAIAGASVDIDQYIPITDEYHP